VVDEIISIIKRQPKGAGVQHVVIVAPRGMGKTTMLLMLRFTVLSQDIAKRWQPVLFPEESYSVYDLADLWVEVIDHIASETGDVALREEVQKLKDSHPDSSDLEAVALASIKDWREKNKKRLLLLIDNFDMILEQIGNEKDNASLRDVLMNDGTMMLVGGSTTFFKEARAYDQPLYNLFKIYNLNGLSSEQMEDLLRRRAKVDGLENFEEILRANRSRLRVLEYFTGGNPRLVLMLYRVLTHSDISEVRRGLEKLLDDVTPYYKAKIEALPPQQRKILDQIARISAETREGLTPTEIASATRLPINQVSSQLKRLADVGYVRAANIRGRSSYYTLSEPLYAIWHQMRFGRNARTRMNWLIAFLRGWYDTKELGIECQKLHEAFRAYLIAGREHDARNALEHRRYLMEAIEDPQSRFRTFESIILGYLELSDLDTLKRDVLADIDMGALSEETRQRLLAAGVVSERAGGDAETKALAETRAKLKADFERLRSIGKRDEALSILKHPLWLKPDSDEGWLLASVEQTDEALESFNQAVRLNPTSYRCLLAKSWALEQRGELDEAVECVNMMLRLQPDSADAYFWRGILTIQDAFDSALNDLRRAFDMQSSRYRVFVDSFKARSLKLCLAVIDNDLNQAKHDWQRLLECAKREPDQTRVLKQISEILIVLAKSGHWALAQELISSTTLYEPLLPLARALEYLLKGDESIIEKLSPEIRTIVDEIVTTLKKSAGRNNASKQTTRKRIGTRKAKTD
jgi:tetratricopeptide (TPR) repeat protein